MYATQVETAVPATHFDSPDAWSGNLGFATQAEQTFSGPGGQSCNTPEQCRESEHGGPAGIRTQDQGIHVAPKFPSGVDYLSPSA